MEAEVVADGRAADPRAQEQRGRLERAGCDDDPRCAHRELRAAGAVVETAVTPAAWPFSTRIVCAVLRTQTSAPCSIASRRKVFAVLSFEPDASPKPM